MLAKCWQCDQATFGWIVRDLFVGRPFGLNCQYALVLAGANYVVSQKVQRRLRQARSDLIVDATGRKWRKPEESERQVMKKQKALKRLAKIEALMSDVTERYSTSSHHVREALQDAKAAVTAAAVERRERSRA